MSQKVLLNDSKSLLNGIKSDPAYAEMLTFVNELDEKLDNAGQMDEQKIDELSQFIAKRTTQRN